MSGWVLLLTLTLDPTAESEETQGRLRKFEKPFRGGGGGTRHHASGSTRSRTSRDADEYQEPFQDSSGSSDPSSSSSSSLRTKDGPYTIADAGPLVILGYPFFDHRLRFEEFPYAQDSPDEGGGRDGVYYLSQDESEKDWSVDFRPYTMRVDEDLFGLGASGTVRNGSGGNFHFNVLQFREDVGGHTDRLMLHKYELNYGPGAGPRNYHWTVGVGLGILDGEETNAGFEIQAAGEWYPLSPLSIRASAALIIFEEASLGDFEAELRIHLDRFAWGAGIRSVVNSDGDDLTGPTVSLTLWF